MSQASPTAMSATGTGWPRTVPARLRPNAPPPVSFAYATARSVISPGASFCRNTSIVAPRRARVPDRSRSISSSPDPSVLRSDRLTSVVSPAPSALLHVALRRDPFRAGGAAASALVLDLDLGLAHRVAHGLGAGVDVLAQPDLLDHPRLLVDYRLLAATRGLDPLLLEHGVAGLARAIHRPALDLDPRLPQLDLLLGRALDDAAAHPHPA